MKYSDQKFYLRRSNDLKFDDSIAQHVDFRCPGNRLVENLFSDTEFIVTFMNQLK